MLEREAQANTFLGSGVAIPHGLGKDRALIHRTGVAVLQLADEVDWGPEQPVRLVVGIAARTDEHIGVLAALTDVLGDRTLSTRLARTTRAEDVVAALTRAPDAGPAADGDAESWRCGSFAPRGFTPVRPPSSSGSRPGSTPRSGSNTPGGRRTGRPSPRSSRSARAAGRRSAYSPPGQTPKPRSARCVPRSRAAWATRRRAEVPADAQVWSPPPGIHAVTGIAAAPGVAIGPLFQFRAARVVAADRHQDDPAAARHALAQALETAREQLGDIHDAVAAQAGTAEAAIFHAHQALLAGRGHRRRSRRADRRRPWRGVGMDQVVSARVADLRGCTDARMAARAADLHDVGQRVLRPLAGTEHGAPALPDQPVILVAEDLAPSDTARLDPRRILGFCTAAGGPTSHTAIIARSLGIPAVVGAGPAVLEQPEGAIARPRRRGRPPVPRTRAPTSSNRRARPGGAPPPPRARLRDRATSPRSHRRPPRRGGRQHRPSRGGGAGGRGRRPRASA